jgi:alpha-beta hydrolase superfamily lysophospholipase
MVAVLIIFFGGGGWYFSDQLKSDAFQVRPYEREYRATVAEIGPASIRILQGDPADGELFNLGRLGLVWQGGYGTVSEITSETDTEATRRFELLGGAPPVVGTEVDVDHWMYPDDYAAALNIEVRQVEYTSPLGTMDAVLIPGRTDTWAIIVHGKDANPRETMRLGTILSETGVSVLAITHRNDIGQPGDPSGYHRYGVTEWEDLEGAVDYSLSQGADRVILGGFSTGGAIVLSFLEHSDRADRVSAVILDSPNIDFGATVDHVAARRKIPLIGLPVPPPLTWVAKTIGSFRFGVDWGEIDYVDRSESLEVPILVLHGVEDPSVPIETSRELAARQPDLVTLVEFEGAKHIQSWNVDPNRYEQAVLTFLARVMATQTSRHF